MRFPRLLRNRSAHVQLLLGKDATEAFEDVGHSDEARALLPDMLVGEFEKGGVRIGRFVHLSAWSLRSETGTQGQNGR